MSTKKTIQINPELFRLPSNKTRKLREKKEAPLIPIVSPNSLKNKLLKRIKEHKNKEFSTKINTESYQSSASNDEPNKEYEDEFYGAINYLSDLAKKTKINAEKERYQRNLNNKTLKQWTAPSMHQGQGTDIPDFGSPNIALSLPPELQPVPLRSNYFAPEHKDIMAMKYKADSDVPYGCLKGGVKPSYKSWIQTRKNYEHPELENMPSVRPPTPPKRNTFVDNFSQRPNINSISDGIIKSNNPSNSQSNALSREERLQKIKNKLRVLQEQENGHKPEFKSLKEDLSILEPIINNSNHALSSVVSNTLNNPFEIPDIFKETSGGEAENSSKNDDVSKKYIKKTIKRKFTLGKSTKMRKVGVLVKDNRTRKNIVTAQKELKKADISDIRKYLRKHGIIKVGSTAPPDVLRKTFECAMMAGDITNTNKDVLLHNFIHDQT